MASLGEIRAQYPQYADMPDSALADALHKKFYADMPRAEFDARVGYDPMQAEAQQNYTAMYGDRRPVRAGDEVSRDTILPFREVQGANGKPQTELAVPGIIAEPVRSAARLFTGGTAPGPVPLSTMPQPYAEQQIGDVMSAGSLAMTGTRIPNVTLTPQEALARAGQMDAAFGAPSRQTGGTYAPSKAPRADPATEQQMAESFGPRVGRDANPEGPPLGGATRADAIDAARRLDVDLPVALARDDAATRGAAGRIASVPLAGEPLIRATRNLTDELGARLQREADARSLATDETAGRMVGEDAARLVRQQTQDPIENAARNLGGASRVGAGQTVRDSLSQWQETGSRAAAGEIYADVNALMPGSGGRLTRTTAALDDLTQAAQESALPPPPIVNLLRQATGPQGMSFEGLQNLRTHIGDMLSGRITPEPNMNLRALDRVYASLSEDLRAMAQTAGEELAREQGGFEARRRLTAAQRELVDQGGQRGVEIWDTANRRFAEEIAAPREQITSIIGVRGDVTPEAIVERLHGMASGRASGDVARLGTALRLMSPQARSELASAVVGRMGRTPDGFSLPRLRADFETLTQEGRQLLFGDSPTVLRDIEAAVAASADVGPLVHAANASGERIVSDIVRLAGSKGGADIRQLQQLVRQAATQESREAVAASIVRKMGVDKNGFSPEKFRTELQRMSPAARQIVFGPELTAILDDIATLSQRIGQMQRLGNPSGTGGVNAIFGAMTAVATSVVTASPAPALAAVGGLGVGYVFARLLARPTSARAVRDYMQAHTRKGRAAELARAETALREAAAAVQTQTAGKEQSAQGKTTAAAENYFRKTRTGGASLTGAMAAADGRDTSSLDVVDKTFLKVLEIIEKTPFADTSLRLFNDVVQRGRTAPITEADFTRDELRGYEKLVLDHARKTGKRSGSIDYNDYIGASVARTALGGFRYEIAADGQEITITDTYDFNTSKGSPSDKSKLVRLLAFFAAPVSLAAAVGRELVPPGKGVPVRINLTVKGHPGG